MQFVKPKKNCDLV